MNSAPKVILAKQTLMDNADFIGHHGQNENRMLMFSYLFLLIIMVACHGLWNYTFFQIKFKSSLLDSTREYLFFIGNLKNYFYK